MASQNWVLIQLHILIGYWASGLLETCWMGALTPEVCCTPPAGLPACFPAGDIYTYHTCCQAAEEAEAVSTDDQSSNFSASETDVSNSAKHVQLSAGLCGCSSSFGTAWLQRSWTLDRDDPAAVRQFCAKSLSQAGLGMIDGFSNTEINQIGHLHCPAGIAVVFAMCALAKSADRLPTTALNFFWLSFRTASLVTHCLDVSTWPLTLAELSENFKLFIEQGANFKWLRPEVGLSHVAGVFGETLHVDIPPGVKGVHNHMEVMMRLNWNMGIWDAKVYWQKKLASAKKPGKRRWHHRDICELLPEPRQRQIKRHGAKPLFFRVLLIGSGPSAGSQHLTCGKRRGELVACDALSRLYRQLAYDLEVEPSGGFPVQCDVDELWKHFPSDYFDLAYSSNALDHTVHPFRSLKQMLRAVRPGGVVLLWHLRNVHPEAWTMLVDGQHQWAFDVEEADSDGVGHFVIWNSEHRWDVSDALHHDGHSVEARLVVVKTTEYIEVKVTKAATISDGKDVLAET